MSNSCSVFGIRGTARENSLTPRHLKNDKPQSEASFFFFLPRTGILKKRKRVLFSMRFSIFSFLRNRKEEMVHPAMPPMQSTPEARERAGPRLGMPMAEAAA